MRVIISGGGTGGHIYPARSIYDKLDRSMPYCEKIYIGSKFGIEHSMLKDEGINYKEINARGFERGDYWYCIVSFFYFIQAFFQALIIMIKFKPDLVIGVGGFVSGPVILAANFLRIDTMIHEQNVVPGLVTQFLSRFTKKILYSYKESLPYFEKCQNKLYYTGNPVRREFVDADREESREKIGVTDKQVLIVSMGGSNGAKTINDLSLVIADLVKENENLRYIHITGKYYKDKYQETYDTSDFSDRVVILPYTDDMPSLMSAADLMICRSGAITLAEMGATSLPGILIPSPNVSRDHQTHNAKAFAKIGSCVVLEENKIDKEEFKQLVFDIVSNERRLSGMREAYSESVKENALNSIISLIYDYNLR